MPIGWMWSLRRDLIKTRVRSNLTVRAAIGGRNSDYTLRRIKNDRYELLRLSKIAHMRRLRMHAGAASESECLIPFSGA
jgi:hypothetical protein